MTTLTTAPVITFKFNGPAQELTFVRWTEKFLVVKYPATSAHAGKDWRISRDQVAKWQQAGVLTIEESPAPAAAPIAATITKEIRYSRLTKDYDMYLDGEYVGSEASYHAAEVELDRLAYEQLDRAGVEPELLQSATALDAGSDQDEIAAEYAAALELAPHLRERTCEGLQFPCDKPVTHCFHIDLGRDGDKQINSSLELCDEHAAEWQSWNPPPPDTPFCFFHGGPADHETHECPRLEEIAERDEKRHRQARDVNEEKFCDGLYIEPCGQPADHAEPDGMVLLDLCDACFRLMRINSTDDQDDRLDEIFAPPFRLPEPCPPPSDEDEDGATCARFSTPLALVTDPPVTLPSDCWGYADTCHNPATQILIVVVSDAAEIALCDVCAAKWRKLHVVLPPVCGNCDGPHHIQACGEILNKLLDDNAPDEISAAQAYDAAAREHHGEFAALNFPLNKNDSALIG